MTENLMTLRSCAVVLAMSAATPLTAQTYPSKPIQLIVSSAPGAGTDLMARMVADRLGPRLGTSLVVDNRVGAGGLIAAQGAKRAAPDGYTLMSTSSDLVFQIALGANKDVNVLTDFQPLILTVTNDFFLVVSGEALEAKNAGELVTLARKRPGGLSYATPGVGAPHHFGMELFKQQTKTFIVHIPYKGMAQGVVDMLAGRVQVTMTGLPAVAAHMKSDKLRILGVASPRRSPAQPDVPTLAEAGVPGVELQGFLYLVAPNGTPAAIVSRLNAEINELLRMPELQAELAKQSMTAAGGTPEQLAQKLSSEAKKWTGVAKSAGIKAE
jgi:tripartite-type tricarboxylate transporter receptor subunit TctC